MTCTKCGAKAAPGASWCELCKGPVDFSASEGERMKVDVRARIIWGEDVGAIRKEWNARGAPDAALRETLESAVRERHEHFRARGRRDLIAGLLFLAAGGGAAVWYWFAIQTHESVRTSFMSRVLACAVLAPVAGTILVVRGMRRLLTGGAHELGATDVEPSDYFD